jgi:hypothetical protein
MDDTERLEQVLRSLRCCIRESTLGRWLEGNPHIDLQYGVLDTSTFELDDTGRHLPPLLLLSLSCILLLILPIFTDAHRETFPDFQCNDGVFSLTALLNKQLDDIVSTFSFSQPLHFLTLLSCRMIFVWIPINCT